MWESTKTFLELMFDEDDIIEIRPFWPNKTRGQEREDKGLLPTIKRGWYLRDEITDEVLDKYYEVNKLGYGIYFGIGPRKVKGKGKNEDVKLLRCLCADFDAKHFFDENNPEELAKFDLAYVKELINKASLPSPSHIINTGGGFHCYWFLGSPLEPEKWKEIQERLNPTLGADGATNKIAGVMRLPGYKNTKIKGNPRDVSYLESELNPNGGFRLKDIEEHLIDVDEKSRRSPLDEDDGPKPNRPTWIEEELERLDLINPGEEIKSDGEVLVTSCDPGLDSARTQINIFSGKWFNFSHDSHKELKENGWREGNALKYFTGIAMKEKITKGKEPKYKQTENYVYKALHEQYGIRFEKFMEEQMRRLKKAVESHAKVKAKYNTSEEELKNLRNLILNNQQSNLILSLRNPSKTAYYLYEIFYPGKLIYRDDFEIYGQKDAAGNEYKFHSIADRLEMIENVYQLLRCSVQTTIIGTGVQKVKVEVPITDVEPRDVEKVLKRMESMPGIRFNPLKYIVPFHRNGEPYDQESIIPFKDYDWNWKLNKKVGDASPETVLHGRLPYNYPPDAELSELALQYLRSTFSDKTIELIRNVMKYFLTMSHAEQKMFYITGRKGRGKGVLFHIIIELIGRYNFALVSPHTLADPNKLLRAEGKLLGGCGDARWGTFKSLAQFIAQQLLAIINREPVELKKLWKDVFETIMDIRLLMVGENLPSELADSGVHLDDKIIVMPVKKDAPNWRKTNSEKKGLRKKLTTPDELGRWCNWALGGDLGDIRNRKEGERKLEEMTKTSSPVHNFVEQCLEFDTRYKIKQIIKNAKYYEYKETLNDLFLTLYWFCDKKKIECRISETELKNLLESALDNRGEYRQVYISKDKRPMMFVGFHLNDEWSSAKRPESYSNYVTF